MMKFEEAIQTLEDIVSKMEDKNTTLEESINLFNEGIKKSTECFKILNESKGKVELLVQELDSLTKENLEIE